jgi:hypothetical protein
VQEETPVNSGKVTLPDALLAVLADVEEECGPEWLAAACLPPIRVRDGQLTAPEVSRVLNALALNSYEKASREGSRRLFDLMLAPEAAGAGAAQGRCQGTRSHGR